MQATARRLSVVSATSCTRRRLIRDVRRRSPVAMNETQSVPTVTTRNSAFRRFVTSILAAIGTLVFLIVASVAASHNWMHDGADTAVARLFSVPWEWSFFVAASSGATGWGYLFIVAMLPLCAYTVIYFIALSAIAAIRTPRLK